MLASVSGVNAFAANFDDAEAALRRGDYASALPIYSTLAETGDTQAMVRLGGLYQKGEGVTRDLRRAVGYFTQAAADGNADAQFNLGNLYLLGEGVSQDDDWAFTYYRLAADQGHVLARKNVNEFYRAAGLPPPAAIPVTPATVAATATPAANADVAPSVDAPSGIIPATVSDDELRAIQLARAHGIVIDRVPGAPDSLPAPATASAPATRRATPPLAEIRKRLAAGDTGTQGDLEVLADGGDVEAQFVLSRLLVTLQSDAGANGEALLWLKRAASGGFAEAQYSLAETYRRGHGAPPDEAEAVTWYRAAARQGHAGARQQLEAIYRDAGIPVPPPIDTALGATPDSPWREE